MTYEKNTLCVRVINKKKAAATFNTVLSFSSGKAEVVLGEFYRSCK